MTGKKTKEAARALAGDARLKRGGTAGRAKASGQAVSPAKPRTCDGADK